MKTLRLGNFDYPYEVVESESPGHAFDAIFDFTNGADELVVSTNSVTELIRHMREENVRLLGSLVRKRWHRHLRLAV